MLARMMIKKELCNAALCFIVILTGIVTVLPSSADEILLATQQPFNLNENTTLVVEDVDPQQGMVWLEIYNQSQNETPKSAVLGLGEHFNFSEIDFAVNGIYAGEVEDLVSLEIKRSTSRIPLVSPVGSL